MRWFRFAVLVIVATILQAGIVDIFAISPLNIKPDLLLILLVFFGIYCDTSEAIITSFTIGFAADLISPAMGPQTVSFGLFGVLLAYLRRIILIRSMPYQSAAVFITSILTGALAYLLGLLKGGAGPHTSAIYVFLLGTALYSAVVGPFLFLPAAWWMGIKTHRLTRH